MTVLPTVKLDLLKSTLTTGVFRYTKGRGVRRVRVTGLENNNRASWNATVAILNIGGILRHPGNTIIPLQTIHLERSGPTECVGVLIYAWDRWSIPPAASTEIARFRAGRTEQIPVYRYATATPFAAGANPVSVDPNSLMPNGPMYLIADDQKSDQKVRPQSYMWRPGTIKMTLPTILSTNPLTSGIDDLIGKVNSAQVTFAGTLFDAQTIRFEGVDVDWIQTSLGLTPGVGPDEPPPSQFEFRFNTKYHFLIRRGAHLHQHAVAPNSTSPGLPPAWTTIDYCPFEQAPFAGAFPVHA